ncbi:hypothetical protein E2986_13419 [Frieseomelitta varia]|uniref:Uncharacterized protein n=1 Tax=Frieseomelitta varia TaxID=561572 RepID=A0A833RPS1_9HYME|nr:hypothetical protein E2986_13419 [Frieseomelitta varia]
MKKYEYNMLHMREELLEEYLPSQYMCRKFTSNYKITIGADFAIKTFDWDPLTKINLQLWY